MIRCIFFLNSTKVPGAIHAFVNVFLSGIHSRLEQDLRIYLGTFLFFLSFLLKLRPGWLLPLHYFVFQSFLNTYTLYPSASLCCHVLTKDVGYVPLPFSIFGSFYPNVRLLFFWQNIGWRYRRRRKKNSVQKKKKHNSCFLFFFLLGAVFCAPLF